MSADDDGKPKEFFHLRARLLIAAEKGRRLRKEADAADAESARLRGLLQDVCPHDDITECATHYAYPKGLPPQRFERMRRCEDCKLTNRASTEDSPLFYGKLANRVVDQDEFTAGQGS